MPRTLAAAWQGRLFLVDASTGTIRALPIRALEEGLREAPVYRAQDRPPMNDIARRFLSGRLEAAPPRAAAELRRIVSEEGLPVWRTLLVGRDGTLFLARTACGEWQAPRKLDVLTPEGEWLGALTTPTSSFRILAGARDRIVAVVPDSLGVERIEVHALQIDTAQSTGGGK